MGACGGGSTEPTATAEPAATEEPPPTAEPPPPSDDMGIAGVYSIAGKNPDTSDYGCMLEIVPVGDVYEWNWFACGEFEGVGVPQENVVSVAWGGDECSAVSYLVQEDGTLDGVWATFGQTTLGTEKATPTGDTDGIAGAYTVAGTNPDGSAYDGTLQVTADEGVYKWEWNAGGEFLGVGIQQENIVSVGYGSENCSIVSYLVQEDGTFDALWTYVGQTNLGSERATIATQAELPPTDVPMDEYAPQEIENDAPARPSAGCGTPSDIEPGQTGGLHLKVGDLERLALVHPPKEYDPNEPTSLVLSIHGYTGSAGGMESTGMSRHADKYGYIVVYPNATSFESDSGMISSWNDLSCNASPGPEGPICSEDAWVYEFPPECGEPTACNWCTCNDDLAYIAQMLDALEQTMCIDLNRVYATGMSNGGMFVHRLGCDVADRFAAIAPVAGTLAKGFNCAPDTSTTISVMAIHGSEDDYVDVTGAQSSDGYRYTAMADVMVAWAAPESQGCDAEITPYPTHADGMRDWACTQNANCATGAEVVSCWWTAGHDWPSGSTRFGNDMIWEFFRQNAKHIQP